MPEGFDNNFDKQKKKDSIESSIHYYKENDPKNRKEIWESKERFVKKMFELYDEYIRSGGPERNDKLAMDKFKMNFGMYASHDSDFDNYIWAHCGLQTEFLAGNTEKVKEILNNITEEQKQFNAKQDIKGKNELEKLRKELDELEK